MLQHNVDSLRDAGLAAFVDKAQQLCACTQGPDSIAMGVWVFAVVFEGA